jgi:hypothetical protein
MTRERVIDPPHRHSAVLRGPAEPALAIAVVVIAACGAPPPLKIEYTLTTGPSEVCYAGAQATAIATSCSDVTMLCQADLSVRVFSPSAPSTPYISLCQPVLDSHMNLCSIAGIDLPPPAAPIPEETLEVDVAVYNDSDLQHDTSGNPICPTDIQYAADGLPVNTQPTNGQATPAVGGRAFYHAGDAETVVTLGCNNLDRLQNPVCIGSGSVDATATVDDFDTGLSVSSTLAQSLSVWIGEPQVSGSQYVLSPVDEKLLAPTLQQPVPGWGDLVQLTFVASACLVVLEDAPQTTPTLTCHQVAAGSNQVDLVGTRLATSTLDQILVALGDSGFPAPGLVVGVVLDDLGNPAPGVAVTLAASSATPTVEYLSADRTTFTTGTGASTSTNGVFVSLDAPYGTMFSVPGSVQTAPTPQLGGVVEGKVTIVVLQFRQPSST